MAIARAQHLALPRALAGFLDERRFEQLVGADAQALLDDLWGPDVPSGLRRHILTLSGGGRAIIVTLPPPIAVPEAHFVALVHDEGDRFRLFVLESGVNLLDMRACTFFCEWVGDRKVEYGEGPNADRQEFVACVESHLDGALELDVPVRTAAPLPPEPTPAPRIQTGMPRPAPKQVWGSAAAIAPAPMRPQAWGDAKPDPSEPTWVHELPVYALEMVIAAAVIALFVRDASWTPFELLRPCAYVAVGLFLSARIAGSVWGLWGNTNLRGGGFFFFRIYLVILLFALASLAVTGLGAVVSIANRALYSFTSRAPKGIGWVAASALAIGLFGFAQGTHPTATTAALSAGIARAGAMDPLARAPSSAPIDDDRPVARAMDPAVADGLREEFHKLAESYVALLRSGRPEEAFRYVGKEEQARVSEAEHARWWREAVSVAELDNIYVGGIAVDPHGGDVSIVTPSKLLLMRVTGTRSPGIVPFDLSSPLADVPAGTAASHWLPLTTGGRRAFTVDRERTRVISVPGIVGLPEWVDRMTGAIVEEIGSVETTGRVSGIAVRDQRPVPVPDDPRAPERRTRWMDASETKGVRILAEQVQGAPSVQTHTPPTVLLPPTLRKGQRWQSGFATIGSSSLPLTFEVVGLRDVPGETGVVSGCLEVRAVGTRVEKPTAAKDSRQTAIAIRRWYAPDAGLVREVRQEATIDQASAGAHDERSKITVLSFTPRRVEPALEIVEHPRDLVARRPSSSPAVGAGSRLPSMPSSGAADLALAKERARQEAQQKLDAHSFGEGTTATVEYGVEWVEDDYGHVYDVRPTVGSVEER